MIRPEGQGRGYLVLLLAGLCLAAGFWLGQQGPLRKLDQLKLEHTQDTADRAETQRLAAVAFTRRVQDAQAVADGLSLDLARLERRNAEIVKEKKHALRSQTTGVACLGSGALRVLHGAPGLRVAGLPETPGALAGAAAGPAAGAGISDSLTTSDTDIGEWILEAGQLYEQCRARVNSIRVWQQEQAAKQKQGPLQ